MAKHDTEPSADPGAPRAGASAGGRPRPSPLRRRPALARNAGLGLLCLLGTAAVSLALPGRAQVQRLSLAAAWVSLAFLATTLLLGPIRVLRGRHAPAHLVRRRELGIWAAVTALIHAALGLQVHLDGRVRAYFLRPGGAPGLPVPRLDAFGLANHAGLVATLILTLLLALSNDASLRRLGTRRWKGAQRSVYLAFVLVAAHGLAYQLLEERAAGLVLLLGLTVAAVVGLQLLGFLRVLGRPR